MSGVTVLEWQLLSFFEAEPTLQDAGVPWCYNDALYKTQQGDMALSFAIAPAYRDVRTILQYNGQRLYKFNGMDVKDVRYSTEGGQELLEIVLSDRERILLRIKPSIEISHNFDSRPL